MKRPLVALVLTTLTVISLTQCKKNNNNSTVPAVYEKLYGASDVYIDGDFVVITTTALPDHGSPYYQGTQWASTKYEAYNGTNPQWGINPNRIASQNITLRIPLNPTVAGNHQATQGGVIGIALNGVPFFNQYAAMNAPLTNEINGFDQYLGHPQQQGVYHYHEEPTYLTATQGTNALLGFLLDGFPVYGPVENGAAVTGLDAYHGHTHATADYPEGIYHYHATQTNPYINGDGYYGTPGTVSQ